jgi:hypothetical protein
MCHAVCLAGPRPAGVGGEYTFRYGEGSSGLDELASASTQHMGPAGYAVPAASDVYSGSSSSSAASRAEQQPPRGSRWDPSWDPSIYPSV